VSTLSQDCVHTECVVSGLQLDHVLCPAALKAIMRLHWTTLSSRPTNQSDGVFTTYSVMACSQCDVCVLQTINLMACSQCGGKHRRYSVSDVTLGAARYCAKCDARHAVKEASIDELH